MEFILISILQARYGGVLRDSYRVTSDFVKRLGLAGELDGHTGCVNCLEWSPDGKLVLVLATSTLILFMNRVQKMFN